MNNPFGPPQPPGPALGPAGAPQPGAPWPHPGMHAFAMFGNMPLQPPHPGPWGHQHFGMPGGLPFPIPAAAAAQLLTSWDVTITTRQQRDDVVRDGQALPNPGWRFTKLTVDSGDPKKTVGLSPLAVLPRIHTLNLKCGWWNWEDLSRLPDDAPHLNVMQECHLTFEHGINSVVGLERHWKIFTHRTLRTLTIEQRGSYPEPDDHTFMDHIDVESLKGTLALKSLQLRGLDVHTLSRVLELPRALEYLTLHFAPDRIPQYFFIRLTMERSDEVLHNIFSPLLSSLISLDFQHVCLSNFKWGRFQRLRYLRVHENHFFPHVGRVWGDLKLGDLIPPTLESLVIFGCRFGVKPHLPPRSSKVSLLAVENDRLGAALRRLADELAAEHEPRIHGPKVILTDEENGDEDEDIESGEGAQESEASQAGPADGDGDGGEDGLPEDDGSPNITIDDALALLDGPRNGREAVVVERVLDRARDRLATQRALRTRNPRSITIEKAEGLVPKDLARRFRKQGITFVVKNAPQG